MHGPHHSAQKSMMTSFVIDGSTTSRRNPSTASRSAAVIPKLAKSHSAHFYVAPYVGVRALKPTLFVGCATQGLPDPKADARGRPLTRPVQRPVRRQSGRSSGVEHNLAKVGVEGSNPFARSSFSCGITRVQQAAQAAFFMSGLESESLLRRFGRPQVDAFDRQHLHLRLGSARRGEAADLAARRQHAVARNDQRYRVGGHRPGPRRARIPGRRRVPSPPRHKSWSHPSRVAAPNHRPARRTAPVRPDRPSRRRNRSPRPRNSAVPAAMVAAISGGGARRTASGKRRSKDRSVVSPELRRQTKAHHTGVGPGDRRRRRCRIEKLIIGHGLTLLDCFPIKIGIRPRRTSPQGGPGSVRPSCRAAC